jgi:hypothetical protein
MSLTSSAIGSTPQGVVGHAGGSPVTVEDLRRHGAERGDAESLQASIYQMRGELALAGEAGAMLGASGRAVPPPEAARALLTHLFGPATCSRLPERVMREHYAATRWRFVAPPAWFVEDLQLLCCEDARDCQRPEVSECVALRAPEAAALEGALKSKPVEDGVLEQEMQRIRTQGRQAAHSEYVFYYDPDRSREPMDGRLQTVDAPIAEAVSGAKRSTWIGPLASRFGYHTLRLKRRRPGVNLPFESAQAQALLRTELCPAFMVDQRARYTHELIRTLAWSPIMDALDAAFGESAAKTP